MFCCFVLTNKKQRPDFWGARWCKNQFKLEPCGSRYPYLVGFNVGFSNLSVGRSFEDSALEDSPQNREPTRSPYFMSNGLVVFWSNGTRLGLVLGKPTRQPPASGSKLFVLGSRKQTSLILGSKSPIVDNEMGGNWSIKGALVHCSAK